MTTVNFPGESEPAGTSRVDTETDDIDDAHEEHDLVAALFEETRFPHHEQGGHIQYFEDAEHDDHRYSYVNMLSLVQWDRINIVEAAVVELRELISFPEYKLHAQKNTRFITEKLIF